MNFTINVSGCKLVELPYLQKEINKEDSSILIIGERGGGECVLTSVLTKKPSSVICTDIMEIEKDSLVERYCSSNSVVKFIQGDFINFEENNKFDYIVCINVLEHFGMNFGNRQMFSKEYFEDDVIRWNHDLKAILKMMSLMKNNESKVIVTVPCGPPLLHNDCNENSGLPWLRRYSYNRIKMIHELIIKNECRFTEEFYITDKCDFKDWGMVDIRITEMSAFQKHHPYTPNAIWAFSIMK